MLSDGLAPISLQKFRPLRRRNNFEPSLREAGVEGRPYDLEDA